MTSTTGDGTWIRRASSANATTNPSRIRNTAPIDPGWLTRLAYRRFFRVQSGLLTPRGATVPPKENGMHHRASLVPATIALVCSAACATMTHDLKQEVAIDSSPSGAHV